MRYPADRNEKSRTVLVRAGASLAKRDGFAACGVDALAGAAGLTSGAFYRHFEGKSELLAAIVGSELDATRARFASIDTDADILRAIDAYLSLAHVTHPEAGCLLPALAPEIARASSSTRASFEEALEALVNALERKVGSRSVASAILTQCVGAVTVARALASESARREVLSAARAAARTLLDEKDER